MRRSLAVRRKLSTVNIILSHRFPESRYRQFLSVFSNFYSPRPFFLTQRRALLLYHKKYCTVKHTTITLYSSVPKSTLSCNHDRQKQEIVIPQSQQGSQGRRPYERHDGGCDSRAKGLPRLHKRSACSSCFFLHRMFEAGGIQYCIETGTRKPRKLLELPGSGEC